MHGKSLGHYRILEQIGRGGMGQVFLAEDTRLKRRVAIKVLPPELAEDPERRERFQREAEAIAALDHPNIVTIHSIESAIPQPAEEGDPQGLTDSDVHFITMALVEGKTLGERIPERGLTIGEFFSIAVPLAEALNAAHRAGVTHRDLKPSNVMVGDDGRVRILDFGLAKVHRESDRVDDEAETAVPTRTGTVLGSAPYMSPEQAQGLELDSRSDIFSLGIVFHEMLAGERPFHGESLVDVLTSILRDTPAAVHDLRTGLPPRISRIIHRCLQKNPANRYQTIRELRADLEDLRIETGDVAASVPVRNERARTMESHGASRSSSLTIPTRPSLAVLPFVNLSDDPEQDYFAGGLSADINADLVKISGLFLISQTTTQLYANKPIDPQQVGRELGVAYVLVGTLRKAGNRVRITAQLVDTRTSSPIWADRFDGSLDDLFALQDEITEKIVTALDVKLASGEAARLLRQSIRDPRARDLFYRAMPLAFGQTRDGYREARRLLDEVGRLEPESSLPTVLAAWTHYFEARLELPDSPPDLLEKAMTLSERAIELGDTSGMAQMLKGTLLLHRRQHEAALEAARIALADRPSCPWAYALKGQIFTYTGRAPEAVDLARQAIRLTPLFPPLFPAVLAAGLYHSGEAEEAADAAHGALELAPENLEAHILLAAALAAAGRTEEAAELQRAIRRLRPSFSLDAFSASQPYQDPADLDHMLSDLRAAGLS